MNTARLALLTFALGCQSAAGRETRTVRFWAMGREGEVVAELARGFERENPGVQVIVQQIPWTAAHEKLLTSFVGDATPDVAQLGNTWVPEFMAIGALEPLDARVAGSASLHRADFFDGIWRTNVVADTTWGAPWYVDTRVMFYRTDLLAKAGSDRVPDTWTAWREAMLRIKARMGPRQYPLLMPLNEWAQPAVFGQQTGALLLRENGRYGGFRDPRFRTAFEFYVGLFRDGLAPALSNTEVANLYQEFAHGNIAMYISGPWNIGEFTTRLPPEAQDKWMTAPLPGPTGPGESMAGGSSLVVFRASKHKADAWKLIEYLSRPAVQVRFYQLTGDLPAVRDAWRDSVLAGNRYARAFRDQLERVKPLPQVPEWEQVATKIAEFGEQVVRGRMSVDVALPALDHDVDALLEKRRWLLSRRIAAAR
jgi:multiple sugar transport system substrate-binding protein